MSPNMDHGSKGKGVITGEVPLPFVVLEYDEKKASLAKNEKNEDALGALEVVQQQENIQAIVDAVLNSNNHPQLEEVQKELSKVRVVSSPETGLNIMIRYQKDIGKRVKLSIVGIETLTEQEKAQLASFEILQILNRFAEGNIIPPDGSNSQLAYEKLVELLGRIPLAELAKIREDLKTTIAKISLSGEELKTSLQRISHDLRSNLAKIQGFADLISFAKDNPEEVEKMSQMLKTEVIKTTKELSILTNPAYHEAQSVDLKTFIEQNFSAENLGLEAKGITLHIENLPEKHICRIGTTQLFSAIENLITNAIKFADLKKDERIISLAVGSEQNGRQVYVEITDNGVGMPSEKAAQLFSPDTEINISTIGTGGEKGNGKGLKQVQKSIEEVGGTISCESTEGTGAIFTIIFPAEY